MNRANPHPAKIRYPCSRPPFASPAPLTLRLVLLDDSLVEIDAKITPGSFSSAKQVMEADSVKTVGRTWETEH